MFHKRIKSFGFAWQGLRDLFLSQPNAWIHLALGIFACLLGVALGLSPVEWATLFLTIGAVFCLEALNTALEYLTDLVSPEYHALAGKAKDAAAAAVLLGAFASILVGLCLFGPKLLALIGR